MLLHDFIKDTLLYRVFMWNINLKKFDSPRFILEYKISNYAIIELIKCGFFDIRISKIRNLKTV